MQQQELPAAAGTSAGAGPPAASLNALNLQNGNFVAQDPPPEYQNIHSKFKRWLRVVFYHVKIELLFHRTNIQTTSSNMRYYANDYETFIEAMELALEVWDQVIALIAWKARTVKKVVITRSVSWDTGMNIYEEESDSE